MFKKLSIISLALILVFLPFTDNISYAQDVDSDSLEDSLEESELLELYEPYENVLDSLNEKYETNVQISRDIDNNEVYLNAVSQSLSDFKNEIETYIKDMAELDAAQNADGIIDLNDPANSDLIADDPEVNTSSMTNVPLATSPQYMTQYLNLAKGGYICLASYKQFHPTLNYATYYSISSIKGGYSKNGSRFSLMFPSYGRTNNNRDCATTSKGSHTSPSGFSDNIFYTYSYTFNAGTTMTRK